MLSGWISGQHKRNDFCFRFSLVCFSSLPGALGRAAAGCGRGEEEIRCPARYFLLISAIALQFFSPTPVSFVVTLKHSRAHPSDAARSLFKTCFAACFWKRIHPAESPHETFFFFLKQEARSDINTD